MTRSLSINRCRFVLLAVIAATLFLICHAIFWERGLIAFEEGRLPDL